MSVNEPAASTAGPAVPPARPAASNTALAAYGRAPVVFQPAPAVRASARVAVPPGSVVPPAPAVVPPAPAVHPPDPYPDPAAHKDRRPGTSAREREGGETGQAGHPETSEGSRALVPRRGFRRTLLPIVVAALAALAIATGYLAVVQLRPDGEVGRWTAAGTVAEAAPTWNPQAATTPNPFGTTLAALTGAPTRLRIPAIGVTTTLESLHLDRTGVLIPPANFAKAGWYADGTAPGDPGPAVIAGHVDSQRGPAVFYRLRELTPGDRIDVVRGGRTVRFTVMSSAWYPKDAFPTDRVYGPTPDRQLRLITCGGVFDRRLRSYRDNLVVYAVAG